MKTLVNPHFIKSLCMVLGLLISMVACAPTFVKGTQIDYTPEKQEVADVIEKYRMALEKKDVKTLKTLVNEGYYENASTTNDPSDDYDIKGLFKLFGRLQNEVKAIKYQIKIKSIEILKKNAAVDLEYTGHYLFVRQERDRWAQYSDKNRVTLRKARDGWRIVSGL
jgi:hypothetical protein